MRIIPIDGTSIQTALKEFDTVIARIETCRGKELHHAKVLAMWEKNPSDEDTCTACDARTFCPSYNLESLPSLPRKKVD